MTKKTPEQLDREIAEALYGGGPRAPRSAPVARDRFDREWLRQEARDKVDAFGSMQYRREKSDWISAGRPKALEDFIPGSGGDD
jgi:hypothetical protein